MKPYIILSIFLFLGIKPVLAQNQDNIILSFNDDDGSPKASLEDISWIAGYWQGDALGGKVEEIWSMPMGGSMMGSFKLVANNVVQFYELETISEENGSLLLKVKHFNRDLTGWEEKDKSVEFRLVKITENKVFFDELTFERISVNQINVYVVLEEGQSESIAKFSYTRKTKE